MPKRAHFSLAAPSRRRRWLATRGPVSSSYSPPTEIVGPGTAMRGQEGSSLIQVGLPHLNPCLDPTCSGSVARPRHRPRTELESPSCPLLQQRPLFVEAETFDRCRRSRSSSRPSHRIRRQGTCGEHDGGRVRSQRRGRHPATRPKYDRSATSARHGKQRSSRAPLHPSIIPLRPAGRHPPLLFLFWPPCALLAGRRASHPGIHCVRSVKRAHLCEPACAENSLTK